MIYLDNAATTFPKPEEVYLRMDQAEREFGVNPGRGNYQLAKDAEDKIYSAKEKVRKLCGLNHIDNVIFSPSATIAAYQVLCGIPYTEHNYVYLSPYEHNACARTIEALRKRHRFEVILLPLQKDTKEIDIRQCRYLFSRKPPFCLIISHISNVTGYILPVKEIFAEAKKYNAVTILDAAQSIGLLAVNSDDLKADFIIFAGHKNLYGPIGIGGFAINSKTELEPVLFGGTGSDSLNVDMPGYLPQRLEPGSRNAAAAAGLYEGICFAEQFPDLKDRIFEHTWFLRESLQKINGIILYAPPKEEQIGIISFVMKNYSAAELAYILSEEYHIAVRSGYHCAPYIHDYLGDKEYAGCVRASISVFTTKKDLSHLVKAVDEISRESY